MVAGPETAARAFEGSRTPNPHFVLEAQMKSTEQLNTLSSTFMPICQIRGIASLFSTARRNEGRDLDSASCNGIFITLQKAADEIQGAVDSVKESLRQEGGAK